MTAVGKGGNRVSNGQDTFPRDGLPSRPIGMSKEENEVWTALMSQIPNELLRRADVHQLQMLCECLVQKKRFYEAIKEDPLDNKLNRTYLALVQQLARLSAMYGLSPIDRRRMKLEAMPEGDDADDWSNED